MIDVLFMGGTWDGEYHTINGQDGTPPAYWRVPVTRPVPMDWRDNLQYDRVYEIHDYEIHPIHVRPDRVWWLGLHNMTLPEAFENLFRSYMK